MQEDPIGFGGSTNVYQYADGQVLESTDPSGLLTANPQDFHGFMPFCTPSGSCIGADGSIIGNGNIHLYVDGVEASLAGGGAIPSDAIKSVTYGEDWSPRGPGRVVGKDKESQALVDACRANKDCGSHVAYWERQSGVTITVAIDHVTFENGGDSYGTYVDAFGQTKPYSTGHWDFDGKTGLGQVLINPGSFTGIGPLREYGFWPPSAVFVLEHELWEASLVVSSDGTANPIDRLTAHNAIRDIQIIRYRFLGH